MGDGCVGKSHNVGRFVLCVVCGCSGCLGSGWRASDGGPRAVALGTCVVLFMLLCTRVLVAALRLVMMMMMMMMRVVAGAADVKVAFEDD